MADDIVTRLGNDCLCIYNETLGRISHCLLCQAADEIERLQAFTEHLASQLRLQIKAYDKAWEAYKEVVGDV